MLPIPDNSPLLYEIFFGINV